MNTRTWMKSNKRFLFGGLIDRIMVSHSSDTTRFEAIMANIGDDSSTDTLTKCEVYASFVNDVVRLGNRLSEERTV